MFNALKEINERPTPFEFYTASELWTNEHTSEKMLQYHLNDEIEASSRNSAFIEKSCNWIADHFNIKGKKIIDFGCGPGLYTTQLAQKGAVVSGIDFSENSINHARKVEKEKGLTINYVVSNYLEFETTEKFDLIIMIMCDFCALSPSQRIILLGKFKALLKPEGSILMDVYSLNAFEKKIESASYEKKSSLVSGAQMIIMLLSTPSSMKMKRSYWTNTQSSKQTNQKGSSTIGSNISALIHCKLNSIITD